MVNLLDTTAFVDFLRQDNLAREYLEAQPTLQCSVVTAAELIQGCINKRAQKETEALLSRIKIFPLTPSISQIMFSLMTRHSLSSGLRIPDALIAATAFEHKLTLVTANTKHFSFIKSLKLLDWQQVRKKFNPHTAAS